MKHFIIALICTFFTLPVYSHTARLFVTLGPKCNFTVEDLQNELSGIILEGGRHTVQAALEKLDQDEKNHLVFLKDRLSNLDKFARRVGYGYIELNCCLDCAVRKVRKLHAKMPTTDEDLPRLNPKDVGLFYDLMQKIDRLFKKEQLTYWATCGTLLGAVRHSGMIPWDDDLDIAIFEDDLDHLLSLEKILAREGLAIGFHPTYEIYKIYPINGKPIIDDEGERYPWNYPFVDIFPLTQVEDYYSYAAPIWKNNPKVVDRDHFLPEELQFPLEELDFGPLKLPVPHNATRYLNRMYGTDWNRVAYVMFSHRNEKHIPKIKVDLLKPTPPAYRMPS